MTGNWDYPSFDNAAVAMKFASVAAKTLGLSEQEIMARGGSEIDMQMLVEAKVAERGPDLAERMVFAKEAQAYTQERIERIRAQDPGTPPAQSEVM